MGNEQWTSCDLLVGRRLVDRNGGPLGAVEELVIDLGTGRVSLVLISRQRRAGGEGDELVAVPWRALRVGQEGDRVELRGDRAAFDRAPGFEPEARPDFTDPSWEQALLARFTEPMG